MKPIFAAALLSLFACAILPSAEQPKPKIRAITAFITIDA